MTRLSSTNHSSRLLRCLEHRPMAEMRLVCFPHAGAGASVYQNWPASLPPSLEVFAVQLPGREDRLHEEPFSDWTEMMASVAEALDTLPKTPVALFGHSLGANIALDAARHISSQDAGKLRHCFFSARPWPGEANQLSTDVSAMSDSAFLRIMAATYGTTGVALENEEIRQLMVPILRADVMLLNSYRSRDADRLACPVTVFNGTDDPSTAARDLSLWQRETDNVCDLVEIEGDHLFHLAQRDQVLDVVCTRLDADT